MLSRKVFWVYIAAFLSAVVIFIVLGLSPKSYIQVVSAPEQISVSVDGKTSSVKSGDKLGIEKGEHDITVTQTDFESYKTTVRVDSGQTVRLLVALKPLTDAARSLLKNDKSQLILQEFYGRTYQEQSATIKEGYLIGDILPIQARLYTINSCQSKKYPNDTTKLAVCVNLYQRDLEPYVIKDVQSRGYSLDDYETIWMELYPVGE